MKQEVGNYLIYLEKELNYSKETIKNYEIDLLQFYDFLKIKSINYLTLNKEKVRMYLKHLDALKYSNKTISRKLSSLRSFYNFLVEVSIIDVNIFNSITNPKVEKKLPNYLNHIEIDTLLDNIDIENVYGSRNKLILALTYATGVRLSELSNIKVSDIDYNAKSIKVMGKGSKERFVYFGEYALKCLNDYVSDSRYKLLTNNESDYLFINKFGKKLGITSFQKIVKKVAKEVSLKHDISMHTLRHTFATHMLNSGADIKTVQELLGHESLSTTGIYTHVSNERIKEVYLKTHPRDK